MPIFAVNLSERLFGSVRELIDRGMYQSLEGFLEVAAYNQLALERGATPDRIITLDHRIAQNGTAQSVAPKVASNGETRRAGPKRKPVKKAGKAAQNSKKVVAEPKPSGVDAAGVLGRWASPSPAVLPKAASAVGMPVGEHLWGQVNRLFPLKLACRWVAKSAGSEGWPAYLSLADALATEATAVGEVLDQWDIDAGRKRDEVLATGLPRRGNSASRDRFVSQNLARVTRGAAVVPGAVCRYALAECTEAAVALTEDGLRFAQLENPILDGHNAASATTLSAQESEFLCRHIKARVPGEHADMAAALAALRAGRTTPATLAEGLRNLFPVEWGDGDFRAHLSGLVARLADLRLIRRRWEGRYVKYELGDEALVELFM